MANELPTMRNWQPATSYYGTGAHPQATLTIGDTMMWGGPDNDVQALDWYKSLAGDRMRSVPPSKTKVKLKQKETAMSDDVEAPALRVVRVFLVDPDENVPVEKRMLHKTDEIVTDATDQELFHEIPVKDILEKHNEYRTTLRDKKIKSKEVFLEPVRIRDLSMAVATVAAF